MAKKRILYIDLMKGLSITWVVWFHTIHPTFVDFGFRMPLFFLASAIFFKAYPLRDFIEKKIYQMLIPFLFFYLIYYVFMILSAAISTGSFDSFDYSCILDIFKAYNYNGGPTVNPPLWFIMALLDLQLIMYLFVRLHINKHLLMLIAFAVSVYASLYMFDRFTYFQFGRALRYLCYYAFGYLYGKDIIRTIESDSRRSFMMLLFTAAAVFSVATGFKATNPCDGCLVILDYLQITSLVILLIYFFRLAQNWWIMKPLKYYGANSYIVLGMNEMILSGLLVIFMHVFGQLTIVSGFIHWLMTMALLVPVIRMLNKNVPWLVGKQNIFDTYLKRYKISCNK